MNLSIFDNILSTSKNEIIESRVVHQILELRIQKDQLIPLISHLKEQFQFDLFLDVTAIDYLGKREERFDLVYHFYSTVHFVRIRIKVALAEQLPEVDTLTPFFGSAHFMERECHEMYGIKFKGNNDLRPILLYGGFEGHPLRKDYPIEKEQPLVPYIK